MAASSVSATPMPTLITRFSDLYDNQGLLHKGAYTKVYRVVDKQGQVLAVKKFASRGWASEILQEIRADSVARQHASFLAIAQILYRPNFRVVLVYPYYDTSLYQWIKDGHNEKCHVDQLDRLIVSLVDGIAFLHNQGYIHGDVKPENVLLNRERPDQPKIIDLNLARPLHLVQNQCYRERVTETWKPPELCFKSDRDCHLSWHADHWPLASIIVTLYTSEALFPSNLSLKKLRLAMVELMGPPSRWSAFCRHWFIDPDKLKQWSVKLDEDVNRFPSQDSYDQWLEQYRSSHPRWQQWQQVMFPSHFQHILRWLAF